MDKSILPGMTRKSFKIEWPFGSKKKKKNKKKTTPGSFDYNVQPSIKKRNAALKEAAGD